PPCTRCSAPLDSPAAAGLCAACAGLERISTLEAPEPGVLTADFTDGARTLAGPSLPNGAAAGDQPTIPGYEILGELGRGGMGVVYRARQVAADRIVALKVILAGEHSDDPMRERFRREARTAAQLQHPGIVQIHEVGEVTGLPFFSMDYIDGGSLAEWLHQGPLPVETAAALVE